MEEIAARQVEAAFEQVAATRGGRHFVRSRRGFRHTTFAHTAPCGCGGAQVPAKLVRDDSDQHGRVGDPASNHHVRAGIERALNRVGAQVRVRRAAVRALLAAGRLADAHHLEP
eukprot:2430221-Prymnesium_polylepis.1